MTAWTDNPASTGARIRYVHVNGLRSCVDSDRSAAGLSAFAWTDGSTLSNSSLIRAVHSIELPQAIQDLWTATAMGTVPNWTARSAPSSSRQVSARDINELRF